MFSPIFCIPFPFLSFVRPIVISVTLPFLGLFARSLPPHHSSVFLSCPFNLYPGRFHPSLLFLVHISHHTDHLNFLKRAVTREQQWKTLFALGTFLSLRPSNWLLNNAAISFCSFCTGFSSVCFCGAGVHSVLNTDGKIHPCLWTGGPRSYEENLLKLYENIIQMLPANSHYRFSHIIKARTSSWFYVLL